VFELLQLATGIVNHRCYRIFQGFLEGLARGLAWGSGLERRPLEHLAELGELVTHDSRNLVSLGDGTKRRNVELLRDRCQAGADVNQ
jgi:hypothetical protein